MIRLPAARYQLVQQMFRQLQQVCLNQLTMLAIWPTFPCLHQQLRHQQQVVQSYQRQVLVQLHLELHRAFLPKYTDLLDQLVPTIFVVQGLIWPMHLVYLCLALEPMDYWHQQQAQQLQSVLITGQKRMRHGCGLPGKLNSL